MVTGMKGKQNQAYTSFKQRELKEKEGIGHCC